MAWTKVELAEESDQEREGRIEHVQRWRCVTDAPGTDRAGAALAANDGSTTVPGYGAAFGDGTYCMDRRARPWPNAANNIFEVQVTFRAPSGGSSDFASDPLDRPLEFRGQPQARTESYDIDAAGNKCAMTNGQYMEPLPQRDAAESVIYVEGNFAANDVAADEVIKNTYNAASVTVDGVTYAATVLKLGPVSWQKMRETINGIVHIYYRKSFEIKVKSGGWDKIEVESRGFVDSSGREIWSYYEPNMSASVACAPNPDATTTGGKRAQPVSAPWPLEGNGAPVARIPDYEGATIELQPYAAATWPYDFSA